MTRNIFNIVLHCILLLFIFMFIFVVSIVGVDGVSTINSFSFKLSSILSSNSCVIVIMGIMGNSSSFLICGVDVAVGFSFDDGGIFCN
jgi:hypothetical protein